MSKLSEPLNDFWDRQIQKTRLSQGWKPLTYKGLDGNWHSYEWLGPLSKWMGLVVDGFDNFDSMSTTTLEKFEKAPVLKEAPKPKRARTKKGTYVADDKSTPDVNEAWEGGKAPKKKATAKKPAAKKTTIKRVKKTGK